MSAHLRRPAAATPLRVALVARSRATLSRLESWLRRGPRVRCVRRFQGLEPAVSGIPMVYPSVTVIDCPALSRSALDGLRRLREAAGMVACILLTDAAADPAWLREALALGVSGLLAKPSSPDILLDALRAVADGALVLDSHFRERLFALPGAPSERSPEALAVLTEREWAVLELESAGLAYKQIASRLRISQHTVKNHLTSIRHKLSVHTSIEVLNKAYQRQNPPAAGE